MRQIIAGDSLVLDIENHNFVVGNSNFVPHDPKPFKEKRLQVAYFFDNEPPLTIERQEHSRLVLPEDSEIPRQKGLLRQHKVEEFKSRQIRDMALADARTLKERVSEMEKELSHWQARYSTEKVNDLNEKAKAENRALELEAQLNELTKLDTSLCGRVLCLHNDILAFLTEKGCKAVMETSPRPSSDKLGANVVEMPALESISVADHERLSGVNDGSDSSGKQQTMDAIHYGFKRQFETRFNDLVLELREQGISDYRLEQNDNGGLMHRYYCANVREIAERLLMLWSRMQS